MDLHECAAHALVYIIAYPTPSGLGETPLPGAANWQSEGFVGAVLPYAALVDSADGDGPLLEFLSVVQGAGAKAMGVGG